MCWRRKNRSWASWISSKAKSPRNWAWRSRRIRSQISSGLNWLIPQHHELIFAEGKCRVGAALIIRKLNLIDSVAQRLDHCPDLAARQSARRNILSEGNNFQLSNLLMHDNHYSNETRCSSIKH